MRSVSAKSCTTGTFSVSAAKPGSPREEIIAGQHGRALVPLRVERRHAAAHQRVVDQVVVHERRIVQHLDGCRHGNRLLRGGLDEADCTRPSASAGRRRLPPLPRSCRKRLGQGRVRACAMPRIFCSTRSRSACTRLNKVTSLIMSQSNVKQRLAVAVVCAAISSVGSAPQPCQRLGRPGANKPARCAAPGTDAAQGRARPFPESSVRGPAQAPGRAACGHSERSPARPGPAPSPDRRPAAPAQASRRTRARPRRYHFSPENSVSQTPIVIVDTEGLPCTPRRRPLHCGCAG